MSSSRAENTHLAQLRMTRMVTDRLTFVESAIDDCNHENARQLLNYAATGIRQLERTYKSRRGAPRQELATKIRYFKALQSGLCGKLEAAMGYPTGAKLLRSTYTEAVLLQLEFPDSPEINELFNKVKSWQLG